MSLPSQPAPSRPRMCAAPPRPMRSRIPCASRLGLAQQACRVGRGLDKADVKKRRPLRLTLAPAPYLQAVRAHMHLQSGSGPLICQASCPPPLTHTQTHSHKHSREHASPAQGGHTHRQCKRSACARHSPCRPSWCRSSGPCGPCSWWGWTARAAPQGNPAPRTTLSEVEGAGVDGVQEQLHLQFGGRAEGLERCKETIRVWEEKGGG